MTGWARASRPCIAGVALLALAGCAQLPRGPAGDPLAADATRTGRLALSVQDQPGQSFSASFEMRGRAEAGELSLLSPIGSTVALLRWQPGNAVLALPGREPQQFPSLDAMVEQATGSPIPVAALFDWLAGVPTPVPGWEPELSQLPEGRLRATRRTPPPQADLRVVLDR